MTFRARLLMISFSLLLVPMTVFATTVYDLTTDWSDAANPSGPWSYREGSNLLPHVNAWQGLAGDFTSAQPAWARFETGTSNLPCFFRSSATVGIAHDWQTGDVVCHTTDSFNGVGSGTANIVWTSPINGTINIAGAVWMGRDIGRGNHWSLSIKGTPVTGGDIASGDAYSRAAPFAFSAGSGGAGVLSGVSVVTGDKLELDLTRTSTPGDYACITWTVTVTALTGVGDSPSLPGLWVGAAVPNPMTGTTSIPFRVEHDGDASLDIYDVNGRLVRSPVRGMVAAGDHTIEWDGRDTRGRRVTSGVYFYRLTQHGSTATGRLTVVR
jgi:hypothetical protein